MPDYPPGWIDPENPDRFVEEAPDNPIPDPVVKVECEEEDEDCEAPEEENEIECFANEEACPDELIPTIDDIETIGGNGEDDITVEEEIPAEDRI